MDSYTVNILELCATLFIAFVSAGWTIFIFFKKRKEKFFSKLESILSTTFTNDRYKKYFGKKSKTNNGMLNEVDKEQFFYSIESLVRLLNKKHKAINKYLKKFKNELKKMERKRKTFYLNADEQLLKDWNRMKNINSDGIKGFIEPLESQNYSLVFSSEDEQEKILKKFKPFWERLSGIYIDTDSISFFFKTLFHFGRILIKYM